MKILLVDDDALLRKLLIPILEGEGHEVIQAEGGEEALGILAEWSQVIDAIITDMQMPLMTGTELLEELEQAGLQIPCLLHSSGEFGHVPQHGNIDLNEIGNIYRFATFHSKMERNYIQDFLAGLVKH